MVTHDRYLMERVTDHQFALIDGTLRHVPRGVDEFLELLAESDQGRDIAQPVQKPESDATRSAKDAIATATKLTGGQIRMLRKTMDSSETKMATVRSKIEDARNRMAKHDPTDFEGLLGFQAEIEELEQRLEELELAWLEAAEQLGE